MPAAPARLRRGGARLPRRARARPPGGRRADELLPAGGGGRSARRRGHRASWCRRSSRLAARVRAGASWPPACACRSGRRGCRPSKYVRWLDFGLPVVVGLLVLRWCWSLVSLGGEELRGRRQELRLRAGRGDRAQLRAAPAALRPGGGRDRARRLGAPARGGRSSCARTAASSAWSASSAPTTAAPRDDPRHHHPRRPAARPRAAARRRSPTSTPPARSGQMHGRAARSPGGRRSSAWAPARWPVTAAAGDRWTFYELDPTVERHRARPQPVHLPARLRRALRRGAAAMPGCRWSARRRASTALLVADAFSSDAIPTHLLTREARARSTGASCAPTACWRFTSPTASSTSSRCSARWPATSG